MRFSSCPGRLYVTRGAYPLEIREIAPTVASERLIRQRKEVWTQDAHIVQGLGPRFFSLSDQPFAGNRTTSVPRNIANPQHSAHSKLQGWSYAVLVHPMGGSHHHIGGSVGSHLPEIQQHAQSWTSVHVCGRPWAPVSEHIMSRYGVLPWLWPPSKAWLVDPMIGLSRHVKDLTSPHPHVMQKHPQVDSSSGLPTTTQLGRSGSAIRAEGGQTTM